MSTISEETRGREISRTVSLEGLPPGVGQKAPGVADVTSPVLSLGCSIPSQTILSLQKTPQNDFHKTHPTSAQCQYADINKKLLVNRAKL